MSAPPAEPLLLHVFSTFVPAGPELRTVEIIRSLGSEYRHAILAVDGRTSAAARLPAEAPVRLLTAPPKAGTLRTTPYMRRLLKELRPDLVLTYNWGAFDTVLAARSLGWPRLVHHEDGFNSDEIPRFKRRRVLARRWVLPWVRRVMVPSESLRRIAREVWRLDEGKVALIPNGLRVERYDAADGNPGLRGELGIPAGAPLLGSVAHLRPVKNFLRLLDVAERLVPATGLHLILLGDGPDRAALENRIARPPLAGRVHLVGHIDDPRPYLRAMDVFAVSSDSEQMPVTLLEAMASGLPVASTGVGDIPHMLPAEQRPFVVSLDEPDVVGRLAAAAAHLVADPALRRRLGAANRLRAETDFRFDAMLTAYRDLYRSALTGPG